MRCDAWPRSTNSRASPRLVAGCLLMVEASQGRRGDRVRVSGPAASEATNGVGPNTTFRYSQQLPRLPSRNESRRLRCPSVPCGWADFRAGSSDDRPTPDPAGIFAMRFGSVALRPAPDRTRSHGSNIRLGPLRHEMRAFVPRARRRDGPPWCFRFRHLPARLGWRRRQGAVRRRRNLETEPVREGE